MPLTRPLPPELQEIDKACKLLGLEYYKYEGQDDKQHHWLKRNVDTQTGAVWSKQFDTLLHVKWYLMQQVWDHVTR